MKGKISSIISFFVIILLLCSGAFSEVANFFAWLFLLKYSSPNVSMVGGIIVRILTFVISYNLVGIIFSSMRLFNSKIMSMVYFIISTLIGFALSYIVWKIEEHIVVFGIVFGIIAVITVVYIIIMNILSKSNKKDDNIDTNK